jgi:hypothetical protein
MKVVFTDEALANLDGGNYSGNSASSGSSTVTAIAAEMGPDRP